MRQKEGCFRALRQVHKHIANEGLAALCDVVALIQQQLTGAFVGRSKSFIPLPITATVNWVVRGVARNGDANTTAPANNTVPANSLLKRRRPTKKARREPGLFTPALCLRGLLDRLECACPDGILLGASCVQLGQFRRHENNLPTLQCRSTYDVNVPWVGLVLGLLFWRNSSETKQGGFLIKAGMFAIASAAASGFAPGTIVIRT